MRIQNLSPSNQSPINQSPTRIAQATETDHSELSTTSTMQGQRSASLSTGYLELKTAGMVSALFSNIRDCLLECDLAAKETYTKISCLMVSS